MSERLDELIGWCRESSAEVLIDARWIGRLDQLTAGVLDDLRLWGLDPDDPVMRQGAVIGMMAGIGSVTAVMSSPWASPRDFALLAQMQHNLLVLVDWVTPEQGDE